MTDWAGNRNVDWAFDLVNPAGDIIEDGLPISGGTLRGDLASDSMWGGQLYAAGTLPAPQVMTTGFVRVTQIVNGDPLTVCWLRTVADPRDAWAGRFSWKLQVIDPTVLLARDLLVDDLAIPAGADVDTWLRARLAARTQGLPLVMEDTSETTRTDLWFGVGTSELEVTNRVLDAAAHDKIRADQGAFVARPWVDPATQGAAYRCEAGDSSIIADGFHIDTDHLAAPNRVVVEARGGSGAAPIRAVAEDRDPASRWSYGARGSIWVTVVLQGADVTSTAAAQRMADRELKRRQQGATTLQLAHAWVPEVVPGAVVEVAVDDPIVDGRYQVGLMDFAIGVGLVSATWQRVGDLND